MSPAASSRTAQPDRMAIPGVGGIVEYARRLGWRRALLRGAYVGANQVITLSIFDCFHLRREDIRTELARTDEGFACRFLRPAEVDGCARQLDPELAAALVEALARGDAAYVIFDGERVASIGLYAQGPTPLMSDLVVRFEAPARYMYRGYTRSEYRGRRLHALGILRAAQELFDRQVPQLVTVCERTNFPATVSVLRMGWRPRGALYRVGCGPWTRLGRTAEAGALGMRLELRRPAPDS